MSKSIPTQVSKSTIARNPHLYGAVEKQIFQSCVGELDATNITEKVQKSPEEKLNKLERRWLAELKRRGYENIKIQAIKLQLGFDCLYIPDFFTPFKLPCKVWSVSRAGHVLEPQESAPTFFETKGHRRQKNMVKLRVAARVHNWAKFVLVEWENGTWKETPISP